MKITLSFEKTQTKDTSIMVDALRASTVEISTVSFDVTTIVLSSNSTDFVN